MNKGLIIYLIVVIVLGAVAGGIVLVLNLKKRKSCSDDAIGRNIAGSEEVKKQKRLPLEDTKKFIDAIEDIQDGILVTDGYTRFITGITCRGVDFYNESISEQMSTMQNYTQFWNILESPIQYRLYSRALDIDFSKNKYTAKIKELSAQYGTVEKEYNLAKDRKDEAKAASLKTDMDFLSGKIGHLLEQLNALEVLSDVSVVQDDQQDYIFEWNYKKETGDVELTKAEIFERAREELNRIASQKIDALSACGVRGRKFTNDEMEDSCRRISKPYTADEFKQKSVSSSSFDEDIITSGSKHAMERRIEEEFRESFGEDILSEEALFGKAEEGKK